MEMLKDKTARMISENEDVARWINNLNSDSARRLYAEALVKFCEYSNLSPQQLIEMFKDDKKRAEDLITDFILSMKGKRTPKSIHNHFVGLKSWLRHNDLEMRRKINYGNIRETPTIENEYPPSQEELARILKYADLRGKTAISMIAFAGLRPSAVVNLRLMDLPELTIENGNVNLTKVPAVIKVKSRFSKNARPYVTFLSNEGCEYLLEYLRYRMKLDETLTLESPVLTYSLKGKLRMFGRKGYSRLIKRTFNRAGFPFRPYVLRSYFDTAIMNARGVPHEFQTFWMGHTGTIEATYTVNKNLPEWQIEEMRKTFSETVEPKLSTLKMERNKELEEKMKKMETQNKELEDRLKLLEEVMASNEQYDSNVISRLEKETKGQKNQSKSDIIKIRKDNLEKYMELRKKGYEKDLENGKYYVMIKK